MYAGLATAAGARRFMAVVGWESTAAQTAAARGAPGALEALQAALAPLMADSASLQVEMLHAHWLADPAAHLVQHGAGQEGHAARQHVCDVRACEDRWNVWAVQIH